MSIFHTDPIRRDDDRCVTLTWPLGETTDHYGEPATAVAELSVLHSKGHKAFIASVKRSDHKNDPGFRVQMFSVFGGTRVNLTTTPCARYSAKALEGAVTAALSELRSRTDEPAVVAVADPTSPA